ncbi:heat shock protein transcriptional repressor HspR [Devriesea agamarum]|uniref:heat shock protein transcriptional repressor HspR n=1 Tax=Devriesea agamarum TaxID=472569 RepID=UPI00071DBDF2|nr:helix-turn-helix transcriptional regulator [Devriesea agamarum]
MMMDDLAPVFVISVAAELSGMHPQTLRTYDRLGIVCPRRTPGRGRRYSARDIAQLRQVQKLSQEEGINLAGIKRILELENQVQDLQNQLAAVHTAIKEAQNRAGRRIFATGPDGETTVMRYGQRPQRRPGGALVVWKPGHPRD